MSKAKEKKEMSTEMSGKLEETREKRDNQTNGKTWMNTPTEREEGREEREKEGVGRKGDGERKEGRR